MQIMCICNVVSYIFISFFPLIYHSCVSHFIYNVPSYVFISFFPIHLFIIQVTVTFQPHLVYFVMKKIVKKDTTDIRIYILRYVDILWSTVISNWRVISFIHCHDSVKCQHNPYSLSLLTTYWHCKLKYHYHSLLIFTLGNITIILICWNIIITLTHMNVTILTQTC